ncbi:MAG: SpoIID/LytB domain-containing protein [Candidatus Eremiobacteraeota bacterium]|nr:SpoIID/LytB domain-containing protein [Candidatus Eremiobacteraeota bacterium]
MSLAGAALPARVRAQSDADPAVTSASPALRVLLGSGEAEPGPAPGAFLFNGQAYRGAFVRLRDGTIVNVVDIEQYLYSVVAREMPARWPATALEAQAICARTYVLQRSNPRRSYDLVPSEIDQVYAGIADESLAGRGAVDASTAQVLRFGNGYATSAYSSCCGGHTEASVDAWGGTPIPYLGGVACTFCTDSPNYRWSASLTLQDLATRFGQQLEPLGTLHDCRIGEIDSSGRARSFELVADRGSTVIKASAFRLAVGPRVLRSLLIAGLRVDQPSGVIVLEGGGLGHGVGMCQWGARGMALGGRTAREILGWYFPGTHVG